MSGADALDAVGTLIRRFVVPPSDEALDAVVLFVAHTYAVEAADCSPYLHISSAERRSGKTTLFEVLAELVAHPLAAASASGAAVYRGLSARDFRRTLLLDEVDAVFGPGSSKSENAELLRNVLNAGTRRGSAKILRCANHGEQLQEFDVFGPKVLSGIGELPETLRDRSLRIRMKRKTRAESANLERARNRAIVAAAAKVQPLVKEWAESVVEQAAGAEPNLPEELGDRMQDAWEPLIALADLAGGEWPQRARHAAVVLWGEGDTNAEVGSLARRLLHDCHEVFGDDARLSTQVLLDRLSDLDESPWRTLGESGLNAHRLGRMLRQYDIGPTKLRVPGHDQPVRGYDRLTFIEPWERWCEITSTHAPPESGNNRNERNNPQQGDLFGGDA